jgi:hypothetical protein
MNDTEKYEKAYSLLMDFESKAMNATDAVKQMSSLVCVYFTINDEPIDSFDGKLQDRKMSILEADYEAHCFFFELAHKSHRALHDFLKSSFSNCFSETKRERGSFSVEVQRAADSERNMQLMLRSITAGVLSERDRLLQYTTGEYYQELSLFIQEVEAKNREIEKMYKKSGNKT